MLSVMNGCCTCQYSRRSDRDAWDGLATLSANKLTKDDRENTCRRDLEIDVKETGYSGLRIRMPGGSFGLPAEARNSGSEIIYSIVCCWQPCPRRGDEWMNEWVNERTNERTIDRSIDWLIDWLIDWYHETTRRRSWSFYHDPITSVQHCILERLYHKFYLNVYLIIFHQSRYLGREFATVWIISNMVKCALSELLLYCTSTDLLTLMFIPKEGGVCNRFS